MGWMNDTYFKVYKAGIQKVANGKGLDITFQRLYRDDRDEMSDCLKPSWSPVDDFIIRVSGWTQREEVENHSSQGFRCTTVKTICENQDSFEIRTKDKKIANWVWHLGEKQGADFWQLKAMNEANQF